VTSETATVIELTPGMRAGAEQAMLRIGRQRWPGRQIVVYWEDADGVKRESSESGNQ
jgi:hypothetical protein